MLDRETEQFIMGLATRGRDELTGLLRGFRMPFDLDFTHEYLTGLTEDRLRHIVLAAFLHARRHAARCPSRCHDAPQPPAPG